MSVKTSALIQCCFSEIRTPLQRIETKSLGGALFVGMSADGARPGQRETAREGERDGKSRREIGRRERVNAAHANL
jgi:hypothetical protein